MNWVHVHDYHKEIATKFVDNCEINIPKFGELVDTKLARFVDGIRNDGMSANDLWRLWGQSDILRKNVPEFETHVDPVVAEGAPGIILVLCSCPCLVGKSMLRKKRCCVL